MKELKPLPPLIDKKTGKRNVDKPLDGLKGSKDLLKTKYGRFLEMLK